jgi:membrane protein DedA with SNARE-associated domain
MVSNLVTSILSLGGKQVLLQFLTILLGTFILEDAATVLAAMRASEGGIPIPVALLALYAGIVIGDLGLYGLGALAWRAPLVRRWLPDQRTRPARDWICRRVFRVVLISRFLPGMRLPTYTACGYFHANLKLFALAAIVATLIWTSMLFSLSMHVGHFLIDHFGAWRWAGAAGFAIGVVVIMRGAARLTGTTARQPAR